VLHAHQDKTEVVDLVRIATDWIVDRRRLFELFTILKGQAPLSSRGQPRLNSVVVRGLAQGVTEQRIIDFFDAGRVESTGAVTSIRLLPTFSHFPTGVALVDFLTPEQVDRALRYDGATPPWNTGQSLKIQRQHPLPSAAPPWQPASSEELDVVLRASETPRSSRSESTASQSSWSPWGILGHPRLVTSADTPSSGLFTLIYLILSLLFCCWV